MNWQFSFILLPLGLFFLILCVPWNIMGIQEKKCERDTFLCD